MEQIRQGLTKLRLSGMTQCLKTLEETRRADSLSLKDGLMLLLQAEQDRRESNRYERLLKNAAFRYRASVEELSFDQSRGLEEMRVLSLATGNYIKNGEAVLITGAAGCGKSFLASALGAQACRQGYTVAYYNMQKLARSLKVARVEGTIIRLFEKLAKIELLIMDDFGLAKMENQQQLDFMEIIEDRHARKATVIASQLPVTEWFDIFSDETLADSIIDRIVYTSHRFELIGDSLRKKR
ncbi:ATP-binding protein [Dysgonomonas sp. 521]|uniref:IS21-like element helper ATPase IstB n=1 Tax=Dysgonomonas sp. 521 TaxID=2302932 RepID=UPI0013D5D7EF|nr:IS21-like element helper ATPase IstB [Dysgonomonas sp. 521]NDV94237.1 ATP-binding protein [Dysgonomonas sp. 521]